MKKNYIHIIKIVLIFIVIINIYLFININMINQLRIVNYINIILFIIAVVYNAKIILKTKKISKVFHIILSFILLVLMINLIIKLFLLVISGKTIEKFEYNFLNSKDEKIVELKYKEGPSVLIYRRNFVLGFSCNSEIYVDDNIQEYELKEILEELSNKKKYKRCFFKHKEKKYGFLDIKKS